jgi:hypothetical protein
MNVEETKKKAIELLPELKKELGDLADGCSDSNLLKFLHWKTDTKRAAERFRAHIKWRKENPWAFEKLKASEEEQLKKMLAGNVIIAPESLVSKQGGSVLVGRMRNNDMGDGRTPKDVCRMVIYLMDRALEREGTQMHGITIFHDLGGISRNNVHPMIPKLLVRGIIGHFPLRINGIYLLNAPGFFRGIFSAVSAVFFPKKLKERVHHVKDLEEIYEVIDQDKLLEEHGGKLQFDADAWVEEQCEREKSDEFESLQTCIKS